MRFLKALTITLGVLCLIALAMVAIGLVMYVTPGWVLNVGWSIIGIAIVVVIFMLAWDEVGP